MIDYYDRDGLPITLRHWAVLLEDKAYSKVGYHEIGPYTVFTRWVGFDLEHPGGVPHFGTPMIFETLVFTPTDEIGVTRWPTESDAVSGHDQTVALLRSFEEGTFVTW